MSSSSMPVSVVASMSSHQSLNQVGKAQYNERLRSQKSTGVTPLSFSKYRDTVKPSSPASSSSSKRSFKEMQTEISPSLADDYTLTPVLWSELERLKFHGMNIPIPSIMRAPPPSHDPRKLPKSGHADPTSQQLHTHSSIRPSLQVSPLTQEQKGVTRISITPSLRDNSPRVSTPSCSNPLTPSSHSPVEPCLRRIAPKVFKSKSEGSLAERLFNKSEQEASRTSPSLSKTTKRFSRQHKSGYSQSRVEGTSRRTRRQTAVTRNVSVYERSNIVAPSEVASRAEGTQGSISSRSGQPMAGGGLGGIAHIGVTLRRHSSLRNQLNNGDEEAPKGADTTESFRDAGNHISAKSQLGEVAEKPGDFEDADNGEDGEDDGSGAYIPEIRAAKAISTQKAATKPKARKRALTRLKTMPARRMPPDSITCTTCDKVLRRSGDYVRHLRSKEHLTNLGVTPQGHPCPGCGDSFTRRDAMIRHQRNTCAKKAAAQKDEAL